MQRFMHAFRGVYRLVTTQRNARIHLLATVIVIVAGLLLRITVQEWCIIIVCTAIVWIAEALNTGLEYVADVASPGYHELIRDAKDISAGGVFIAAIASAIVGSLIFVPYVIAKF